MENLEILVLCAMLINVHNHFVSLSMLVPNSKD